MSAETQNPQTAPPTDGFDRFTRYKGRRLDAVDDCPSCGTECYDVWLNVGATAARLVCVGCGAVHTPEVVVRD